MKFTPYLFFIITLFTSPDFLYGCTKSHKETKEAFPLSKQHKLDGYLIKANQFLYKNPDSSSYYIEKAEHVLDASCTINRLVFLHFKASMLFVNSSDIDQVINIAKQGLKLAQETDYIYYQFKFNQILAISYTNDIHLAHKYYMEAYQQCKLLDSDEEMINIITNLINFDLAHSNKSIAKEYISEMRNLLDFNNPDHYNIAHVRYYAFKAQITETLNDALLQLDTALELSRKLDLKSLTQNLIVQKSITYEIYGDYLNAIDFFEKAENYARQIDRKELVTKNYLRKAYLYTQLKDFEKAKLYFEFHKASRFANRAERIFNVNKLGSQIYEGINDDKKTIHYLKQYTRNLENTLVSRSDSISFELENRYRIEQTKNQLILKEEKIKRQEIERYYSIIIIIILFIIVLLIYYWRYLYNKQELKATRKILKNTNQINEFRKRFIENITHEIRTPLTLINGVFETVISYDIEDKYKGILNIGYQNSKRLNTEMENILNLMKTESIVDIVNLRKVYLLSFFTNLIESYKLNIFSKGLTLQLKHNLDAGTIAEIDSGKIGTILSNYLNNAIKFSKEDDVIEIEIKINNDGLFFSVKDFGNGIPKEDLPYVFNRFYQASNTKHTGHGVGLAIVKEISKLLKGETSVDSDQEKGETVFAYKQLCTVNKYLKEETIVEYNTDTIKSDTNGIIQDKPHILVVDDSELMIEFYKQILSSYYKCDYAFNGKNALDKIMNTQYDCLITDVMMPKMDGFELAEKIIETDKTKHLPIIFVTAITPDKNRLKAFRIGVHDFITKPFIVQELVTRISNLIENRSLRIESIQDNLLQNLKVEGTNYVTDEDLLKKIIQIINENISNVDFKVSDLATSVFYSERQLARKINLMAGLTPSKLILEIRLLKAYNVLKESKSIRILDVQRSIGIKSSTYFNKAFKERFGITPSSLQKNS